jgi:tetratricopeptide (TPR) repeat protein
MIHQDGDFKVDIVKGFQQRKDNILQHRIKEGFAEPNIRRIESYQEGCYLEFRHQVFRELGAAIIQKAVQRNDHDYLELYKKTVLELSSENRSQLIQQITKTPGSFVLTLTDVCNCNEDTWDAVQRLILFFPVNDRHRFFHAKNGRIDELATVLAAEQDLRVIDLFRKIEACLPFDQRIDPLRLCNRADKALSQVLRQVLLGAEQLPNSEEQIDCFARLLLSIPISDESTAPLVDLLFLEHEGKAIFHWGFANNKQELLKGYSKWLIALPDSVRQTVVNKLRSISPRDNQSKPQEGFHCYLDQLLDKAKVARLNMMLELANATLYNKPPTINEARRLYGLLVQEKEGMSAHREEIQGIKAMAFFNLGRLFLEVHKDLGKAENYLTKAINLGNVEAVSLLKVITHQKKLDVSSRLRLSRLPVRACYYSEDPYYL